MELVDAIRRRRMCRDFTGEPIDAAVLEHLLELAHRVPSAGFSQGFEFLVLEGPDTARYWDRTLPAAERERFPWPGLLRAPVLILPLAHAQSYLDRYSEPDKAAAGLGERAEAWPVPYWYVDTAFAVQNLLLGAVDCGLGALFFGIFRNEAELLCDLGVPAGYKPIGAIALGHPSEAALRRGAEGSARTRARRRLEAVVHHGHWGGTREPREQGAH